VLPDWQDLEHQLFEQSKAGILHCAAEHPETLCSFFAYDANPIYGGFYLCFDTPENALEVAQRREQEAMKRRAQMLTREESWRHANYFLTDPKITDYSPNVGYFAYHAYVEIEFERLNDLHFNDGYPEDKEHEDNYSEGNGQLMMWRVLEWLIDEKVFASLRPASPFRLGYQLHDDELVVLRILNWPEVQK
jgi:hypothetical protein